MTATAGGAAAPQHLRTEHRRDPIGIDARHPRLSWRLSDPAADGWALAVVRVPLAGDEPNWEVPAWEARGTSAEPFVRYAGPPLGSIERYAWRVRESGPHGWSEWSHPAVFEIGLLDADRWLAHWIAHRSDDLVSEPEELAAYRAAPLLRTVVDLPDQPAWARLYATALGIYTASIGEHAVDVPWLAPGWTDYNQRIEYQAYDVTAMLRAGANVLGVRLGDGWYSGHIGESGRWRYGDAPAFRAQLHVGLPDGSELVIVTDRTWISAPSGTSVHDLLMGERRDLRAEPIDWETAWAPSPGWTPVVERADPGARMVAARDDGIGTVAELDPVSIQAADGAYLVDFGLNVAGVVDLETRGQAGRQIVIRHAEVLDADGRLYTASLRRAEQRDEVTPAADGALRFRPRFTYHGFRYAELRGLDAAPDRIRALAISSAREVVGSFTCSDPIVNTLHANIVRSLQSNFVSVPTDCPQRDERLGWAADIAIFAPTALTIASVANLLEKWLDDLADAQRPSGAYPDVAPMVGGFGAGNTGWADAGLIVPWALFERCGDPVVLARRFDSMRRFFRFLTADQTDGMRHAGRYGDWVSLGPRTDKTLIGTAYLVHSAETFGRIAAVLGEADDVRDAAALAAAARTAFRAAYLDEAGLTVDTQTAHALVLAFDLVPPARTAAIASRLAALVEAAGTHLATGFLGIPHVLAVLSAHGFHDLACRLVRQDTYPSWGFQIRHGATTTWERWNGWTPEAGFATPRMNSFNHYAFGAVGDWLYRSLAGLEPTAPGYRETTYRPGPGGGFSAASASHESPYGEHRIAWQVEGDKLEIEIDVPPGTIGRILVPGEERPRDAVGPGRHRVSAAWPGHLAAGAGR